VHKLIAFCSLLLSNSACKTTLSGTQESEPIAASSAFLPSNPCSDAAQTLYGPPGTLPESKGAIIKCAFDEEVSATDLEARARAVGYEGAAFTSGARIYRILYRTERPTQPQPIPGYSVAMVYIPTTPRAAKLPVIAVGHGSRGQAAACPPSLNSPEAASVQPDFLAMALPLVGGGYAAIAPDSAGFANFGAQDNPPSGYAVAADVGRSLLDGGRALRQLLPSAFTNDVVLVGHSQGGHSVLSSLALASSYGVDGNIAAVVTYAPLWINQEAFGAVFAIAHQFPIATSPNIPNGATVWYHYTAGYLYDGPEHAMDPFKPELRDQIKTFVNTACWTPKQPQLEAMGTTVRDLFTTDFQWAVTPKAVADIIPCMGNHTCQKWVARYKSERPHLDAAAAKVPLLLAYGTEDKALVPVRMACAIDRLRQDKANLSLCIQPGASHGGIVRQRAAYVNDWIASLTLGSTPPEACPGSDKGLVDDSGAPVACTRLPSNHGDD